MKTRPLLRVFGLSPIVAAALVLAVWFSTPGPLRGQMLSMAASRVPVAGPAFGVDRTTVASEWLEQDVRTKAAQGWADVRLSDAAKRTSIRASYRFDEAARAGTPTAFMIPSGAPEFAPLREFAVEFPGTQVDAYLVEQPPMPAVVLSGGVPLGSLPASPFATAWAAHEGDSRTTAFQPREWKGFSANATDSSVFSGWIAGDNEYYGYSWIAEDGHLYRAYAFAPPREQLGRRVPGTVNASAHYPRLRRVHDTKTPSDRDDSDWCVVCHLNHTTLGDDGVPDRDGESLQLVATAIYAGGPVEIIPKPQFTTRDRAESERIGGKLALYSLGVHDDPAYFQVPSALATVLPDASFASIRWVVPSPREGGGPTMLFVATYTSDPHLEFTAWRESGMGKALMATRLWLALQLPWLLAVTCTLLGVTLVASPLAFAADRRLSRRDEAVREIARIQRDAHDRVYNRLGALSKRVDGAASSLDSEAAEDLNDVAKDIRSTLADLQAILADDVDRDGDLDGFALVTQLRATAAAQAALRGLTVELAAQDEMPSLPVRLGWDLQCVLDEAITNAARHAGATHLEARLTFAPDGLHLDVHDDGVADAGGDSASRGSTGISGMRQRLGAWGGSVSLERGPEGSTLHASVPLPPKPA